MAEEKKLIIDEDWKKQAQQEKEKLSKQEEAETQPEETHEHPHGPLPPGNLAALISMLVTQALFAMGMLEVEGQKREPDLALAKYHIEMLTTVQEKTKGNLSKEEEAVLDNTLSELRMAFVKLAG